ncbi:MAG: hypothetical protein H6907_11945 [Hyphomicrobiales bacterium]|nr:hypothetical protein [Hyphomicrobiales bacterium]MCP5372434.1 hypothetical protein [Hyphomicrobiales bacterium]
MVKRPYRTYFLATGGLGLLSGLALIVLVFHGIATGGEADPGDFCEIGSLGFGPFPYGDDMSCRLRWLPITVVLATVFAMTTGPLWALGAGVWLVRRGLRRAGRPGSITSRK